MCGIVGFTGARQAAPILLDGLRKLEYRGYDSAGIAVQGDGEIRVEKVSGQIDKLIEKTDGGRAVPGVSGIGHTRWATHGAPTDLNAHPHLSNDGRFAVVHNGIIENYAQLRQELIAQGYTFRSETDTEVIALLLEANDTGDPRTTIMKAAARLEGSWALGVISTEAPGTLYLMRMAAPLILGLGVGENYFASDVTALVSHTKNVIYMEDGEFAEITPEAIQVFDPTGALVKKEISRITWDIEASEKGGYEHFMLKEIFEQPKALKSTIDPRVHNGEIAIEGLDELLDRLPDLQKIVITACGSAYHAGCVGRYVIEDLCRVPVAVEVASELRYRNPIIDSRTLLIVISQSGETADTIAALKECKAKGAAVLAIVNVVGSTIAKLADYVVYTWAGPEIAVATTKGYTTQLAVLDMIAIAMAKRLGTIDQARYNDLVDGLCALPERVQRALDMNHHAPKLAEQYYHNAAVFFIGRNIDYAVALEGSLKLKEISYLHSEAYAAGELKHGTIALITQDQLVVSLVCVDSLFDKMMSNIKEVKARGAKVLAVTMESNRQIFKEADSALFVPTAEPLLSAIPEIIPLQLFAYYVARKNGCDIDKPRNLAKSVTVE